MDLDIEFLVRGSQGRVHVDIEAAAGPNSSGRHLFEGSLPATHGAGLPVCTATVSYEGLGYAAVMGWVQFVQSSDSARRDVFELDPLALYRHVNTPYAFFGVTPTLFDAPYRDPASDVVWHAHSFLAVSPDAVLTPAAVPLLAFSWGFRIEAGAVTLEPPV